MNGVPDIRRVRHETKRRQLTITRVEPLGSNMLRVVARGEALEGFTSLGFDDHVKLFFPFGEADHTMRDFTPRRYDARTGELWIDFFLHEAGPAASWAAQVAVGQTLTVGGPRGSSVISPEGIEFHLMIGDETALPAIGRRLEELPAGARVLAVIETEDGSAGYPLKKSATSEFVWISRSSAQGAPGQGLIDSLRTLNFPRERCFAWAALESQSARAIRRYLVNERGFDKHWVKAAGYWQHAAAGVHEVIQDED
jgi:NADPH-dependent ferric siderophore reductase